MSILIRGMEMPKGKSAKLIIRPNGNAWLMSDGGKWLEVVEVPTPHGRLIEENYLTGLMDDGDHYPTGLLDAADVYNAPTIIEAEGVTE